MFHRLEFFHEFSVNIVLNNKGETSSKQHTFFSKNASAIAKIENKEVISSWFELPQAALSWRWLGFAPAVLAVAVLAWRRYRRNAGTGPATDEPVTLVPGAPWQFLDVGGAPYLSRGGARALVARFEKAVAACKEAGLATHAFYIIGLPWETRQSL